MPYDDCIPVAYIRHVAEVDYLDYLTDALSGLNVRPNSYLVDRVEVDLSFRYDDDPVEVPYAVMLWDDGLDYDEDGNAYYDDAPGYHATSYHRTRKGAEIQVAHHINWGVDPNKLLITEDITVMNWELRYHPIQD